MNSVLAQPRSSLSRTGVLSGGKAPQYWNRDLFRQTDRMAGILRSCVWIEELNQIGPLIMGQPLLGNCLEELTARGVKQSDVAGAQPSKFSRDFNHKPASRSKQRDLSESVAHSPLSLRPDSPSSQKVARTITNTVIEPSGMSEVSQRTGQLDKVSRLPSEAEGTLLRRFAGAADGVSSDNEKSSTAVATLPVRRPTSPAPVFEPLLPSRDWRDLVAYRAAKELLRHWPAATAAVSSSNISTKVQVSTCSVNTSPLLKEQWLRPLDGPTASSEILFRLVQMVGVTEARTVSEKKWTRPHLPTDNKSLSARLEPEGPAETALVQTGEHVTERQKGLDSRHFDFIPQPEPDGRLLIEEVGRRRLQSNQIDGTRLFASRRLEVPGVRDADRSSSLSNIAPSTLTPSMPPLLPPASPGSAVLPMAAETARRGAWHDEVSAQEKDLSLLAVQMKRILDEEARRHGIDV